jgi:chlorobactene glucosyltransferase
MGNYRRSVLFSSFSLPLGMLAELNFRRLQRLSATNPHCVYPPLSVIIPARDEMHNLQVSLPSLLHIDYPAEFEIIVVDDHSSDDTSNIAASYGVQTLNLSHEIPSGWKGKPYACHQGARIANGEWLLFTDADTIHTRGGIARAVCYAQSTNLDGLSLLLAHQGISGVNRLVLDTAFAGLFAGWSVKNSILNGQYILIRQEAYFESGGFAAVRNEALEDVAFGNLLADLGYCMRLMNGDDVAGVNMHATQKQMFDRLARLGSGTIRWQGFWAGLTALYVAAFVSPLITLIGVLIGRLKWFWFPITWGMATLSLLPWSRRSNTGKMAILAPLGGLVVLVTALFGLLGRITGIGVSWKGRKV